MDFENKTVSWDSVENPMHERKNITTQELQVLLEEQLEPSSTRSIHKRAIKILDTQYEKANLAEITETQK